MLKVLSARTVQGPTNAQRQEAATLKDLVLHCIVRMVHIIHECSPDQVSRLFGVDCSLPSLPFGVPVAFQG